MPLSPPIYPKSTEKKRSTPKGASSQRLGAWCVARHTR
jgi:hypothetical protein